MSGFRQRFMVLFGVMFIYLVLGVFFRHQVGTWLSALWYIMGIVIAGVWVYSSIKAAKLSKSKEVKVVDAEWKKK